MHPAQASPSELIVSLSSAATRRPSVRSPPRRRLTCPRVRTPPRPCRGAHLTRVSALSGPGTRPGIRPVIRHRWRRSQLLQSRFPAAFRPPAFASRVILCPPGTWAFLTVGLPGTTGARTLTGLPRFALRDTAGVGASSTPGTAVPSWPDAVPGQRLPLPSGQSLRPRACIPPRGYSSRGINGGSRDSPARPAPRLWPPGWDGRPLGFPLCSAPRRYQRRTTGRGRA